MYRPLSKSREVESVGRIRPPRNASVGTRVAQKPEHAMLTYQYYDTLSKPRSQIFTLRPVSAAGAVGHQGEAGEGVPIRQFDAPDVVRAATPFAFSSQHATHSVSRPPTASSGYRLPPLERVGSEGPEPSVDPSGVAELTNVNDPDLASFGISTRGARGSVVGMPPMAVSGLRPSTSSSEKLVCFVGDRPISYYTSPLRRGPGRLRSAGALALQLRSQSIVDGAPMMSQGDIDVEQHRVKNRQDTQQKLNRLLRCGSAASRSQSPVVL